MSDALFNVSVIDEFTGNTLLSYYGLTEARVERLRRSVNVMQAVVVDSINDNLTEVMSNV